MDGKRIALLKLAQVVVKRPPFAHVVFSMDFEKADLRFAFEQLAKVLGLEPQPGTDWERAGGLSGSMHWIEQWSVHEHDSGQAAVRTWL
ncbi:hypothetical protein D3C75_1235610 [compost metagenome]